MTKFHITRDGWIIIAVGKEGMVRECGGGGGGGDEGRSRNDAAAAATRYLKAQAKNDPTASTAKRISFNTGALVTALIEPPDQAKTIARYMLEVRGGVSIFIYLQ